MLQWHILDSLSETCRDSILHQLKTRSRGSNYCIRYHVSDCLLYMSMYPSVWSPFPASVWFSASLCMGSPSVMVSSSSKLPLCHGQMVSKHLQLCRKLIADNVSFPKSASKIPCGGLMQWDQKPSEASAGLQQKKWADQSGQAWPICPSWSQEGRKTRLASPDPHGLRVEEEWLLER